MDFLIDLLFGKEDVVMAIAWWIPMLAMAARGGAKAKRQQIDANKHAGFRKEAIKYSPWTGMADPGAVSAPSLFEGGVGGAAQGMMLGGGVNQMMGAGNEVFSGWGGEEALPYNKANLMEAQSQLPPVQKPGPVNLGQPAGSAGAMGAGMKPPPPPMGQMPGMQQQMNPGLMAQLQKGTPLNGWNQMLDY